MGRKCSVYGCKTGYESQKTAEKITMYSFPKNSEERQSWISSLPNRLKYGDVSHHMGVCSLHWPSDVSLCRRGRYFVPSIPPNLFKNVPSSCVPLPLPKPRSTTKSTTDNRVKDVDEMEKFQEMDSFKSDSFLSTFQSKLSNYGMCGCDSDSKCFVLISNARDGPIPAFSVYLSLTKLEDGTIKQIMFQAYRQLKSVSHPSFPKRVITCWSQLDEILRFISSKPEQEENYVKKQEFILRQIQLMNSPRNSRLYGVNDLCMAFSWCTRSRALYSELRNFLQLPSLSTIRKITRIAKNSDDEVLFKNFFQGQEERSKGCIVIIDEIYVKASVSYRGGTFFGYAEDVPSKMATTLLCVMVKCFFDSKKFLAKLLPCHALTASFQYQCVKGVINSLEGCGARVIAVINDNNRVNQSFFRMFSPFSPDTPWIVKSLSDTTRPMFLIYDPVHIMKNIRNNWLTEKTQTLSFPVSNNTDDMKVAKWSDLKELHDLEATTMVKLSKLTKVSVCPSNVEKQRVPLALNVFCDQTMSALKTSSGSTDSWKNTALFIGEVVRLWKLWNCKSSFQDTRFRDPDQISIDNTDKGARGINTLQNWAALAVAMRPGGSVRFQCLTKDTSEALKWTCKSLAELCRYLLDTPTPDRHAYVCLGFFQQDDLEQHFGHFRISAGCNYYVTVQEVFHTHSLDRAKFMLFNIPELDYSDSSHNCNLCSKDLADGELLLLDEMVETDSVDKISNDEKMALFYIAGYVASKHQELSADSCEMTNQEVGSFLNSLNRGGLSYPSQNFFQFVLLSYYFFVNTTERCCRNRLVSVFSDFAGIFHILDLTVTKAALRRVVNIFMKRYSKQQTPENRQQARKIAKLSSK